MDTDFLAKWFTGKALVNATDAVRILNASIEVGYWVERGSTKVPAALSKSNVAKKVAFADELDVMAKDYTHALQREAWSIEHNFMFGNFMGMANVNFAALEAAVTTDEAKATIAKAKEFVNDFAEVVAACAKLDKESEANKKLAKAKADGNPVGICACCFRAQKVQPSGTMFNHGYERPGVGYIIGGCPGSRFPPYSV